MRNMEQKVARYALWARSAARLMMMVLGVGFALVADAADTRDINVTFWSISGSMTLNGNVVKNTDVYIFFMPGTGWAVRPDFSKILHNLLTTGTFGGYQPIMTYTLDSDGKIAKESTPRTVAIPAERTFFSTFVAFIKATGTDGETYWYRSEDLWNRTDVAISKVMNLHKYDIQNGTFATATPGWYKSPKKAQVPYVDVDGTTKNVEAYILESATNTLEMVDGWYAVTNEVKYPCGAACVGDVKLILADTGKMIAEAQTLNPNRFTAAGVSVTNTTSLVIYGQSAGTGELIAAGTKSAAGIGGNANRPGSNITINGGIVKATGGENAPGIGTGSNGGVCWGITINGGVVTAKGGAYGAGIGGANNGGTCGGLTINGGTVTATGGSNYAPGIGGGVSPSKTWNPGVCSNVVINGGTVIAVGSSDGGPGIGGGYNTVTLAGGYVKNVRINGGKVTATGGTASVAGIGNGLNCTTAASEIFAAEEVIVKAGTSADPTTEIAHTVKTDLATALAGKQYVTAAAPSPITIAPKWIPNTTFKIYVNGEEVKETSVEVKMNTPAYVIYTADEGYVFNNDQKTVQYACDTSVNPAVVGAPDTVRTQSQGIEVDRTGKSEVKEGEQPKTTEDDAWQAAINMVSKTQVWNEMELVSAVTITNFVATNLVEQGATKFTVEVKVAVTPKDAKVNGVTGKVTEMTIDVTPTLVTKVEKSGEEPVITEQELEKGENPILISFDVSLFDGVPQLIEHRHAGKEPTYYAAGTEPTTSTFVYDAEAKTVSMLMLEFSDNIIYSYIPVGDNVVANIVDGVCTISGTGDMWSYLTASASPLYGYSAAITKVVIADGVTSIGSRFFENMWNLQDVTIGADVKNIGERAFKRCYGLTNVTSVATGAQTISDYAFAGCHSLQALNFAGTPTFGKECYTLQAAIYMRDGYPEIYPIPTIKIGSNGGRIKATNTVSDDDSWVDVTDLTPADRSAYHFFKIVMP